MSKRTTGLIPRYSVPIVHRQTTKDTTSDNPWAGAGELIYTFTKGVAAFCTIQQPTPEMLTPEEQGLSQDTVLMIRTETPIYGVSEGTDFLGTSVYVANSWFGDDSGFAPISKGGWFTIVKPYRHGSGVINHYQAMLVKDSNHKPEEYPDITALELEVATRGEFLSGDWSTTWLS
tara:strand:- start:359 stop:883 length:525 start_codon:yes stop_codon:yes gene_type:complete